VEAKTIDVTEVESRIVVTETGNGKGNIEKEWLMGTRVQLEE
jgi:hypothetical protein